jgi:hypothetical protein
MRVVLHHAVGTKDDISVATSAVKFSKRVSEDACSSINCRRLYE